MFSKNIVILIKIGLIYMYIILHGFGRFKLLHTKQRFDVFIRFTI